MDITGIVELRKAIENGETTLEKEVAKYIANIEQKNGEINAVTHVYSEKALERAREIDQKIKDGSAGMLAGAIFGIKEAIVEQGKIASSGSKILEHYVSPYNATVIDRLLADDAILLSRMNMDEFAMGSSTENSAFGPVRNPHNLKKVPGGSSGGSAAALPAAFANVTLGSDTGGSIRQPAGFCGVVGLKPSYGRVSRYGLIAYASSFDSIGPLSNTVDDAALVLESIAGRDERDQTTSDVDLPSYSQEIKDVSAKGLRVGVPEEYFGEGLDSEIKARVELVISKLKDEGATIVPIHLPHSKFAVATYYVLATAEASSNLARFDGIRYGHRADGKSVVEDVKREYKEISDRLKVASETERPAIEKELRSLDTNLIRLYKQSRTEGFGAEVKRRIILGTYVLSSGYYDAYYGKAQRVRRLIQQDFKEAFESVDVIISPTAPTTAFNIGEKIDNPVQMYLNDIYTISVNLAGICGISVPAGRHSDGLPIGVQFMGNTFDEVSILRAAKLVEQFKL